MSPRCPRTAISSQRPPSPATCEPEASASTGPASNTQKHQSPEPAQRECLRAGIADRRADFQSRGGGGLRAGKIAKPERQNRLFGQGESLPRGRLRRGGAQALLCRRHPLRQSPPHPPVQAQCSYHGQGIVWRPGAAVVDGRPAGWVSHRRDGRGRGQCPKLSVGALGQFPEIGTVPVRHRDAHARRGQGGGRAAGCGARCPGGLAARADRVRLGPRLVCLCAGLHIPNAAVIANPAL